MTQYLIEASTVRNADTGEVDPALIGQAITVVDRGTETPVTILEQGTLDPIPGSQLTVTTAFTLPPFILDDTIIGTLPEDLYLDWYDPGSGKRGPIGFEAVMREVATAARDAAQAAAANNVGVVRSVNGQVPDENGAVTVSGAGGSGVVVLPPQPSPVPEGTPSGTLIARAASVPPPGEMAVVTETATTYTAASGSDVSLSLPSGITAGDLLVAVITHQNVGSTWTPPAGWVLLQNLDNSNSDFRATSVYALNTDANPPVGTQTFSNNTSGRLAGTLFRVTGADLTAPLLAGGAIGTRPDNSYTVPLLTGSADGLVLSVTNGQQASEDPDPHPLAYSNTLSPFVQLATAASGSGAKTFLDVAWQNTDVDFPEHTVTTAGVSITAMGSQVLALRGAAA